MMSNDEIANRLGQLLLKGYTMLATVCPRCEQVPRMRDPQGRDTCVACQDQEIGEGLSTSDLPLPNDKTESNSNENFKPLKTPSALDYTVSINELERTRPIDKNNQSLLYSQNVIPTLNIDLDAHNTVNSVERARLLISGPIQEEIWNFHYRCIIKTALQLDQTIKGPVPISPYTTLCLQGILEQLTTLSLQLDTLVKLISLIDNTFSWPRFGQVKCDFLINHEQQTLTLDRLLTIVLGQVIIYVMVDIPGQNELYHDLEGNKLVNRIIEQIDTLQSSLNRL